MSHGDKGDLRLPSYLNNKQNGASKPAPASGAQNQRPQQPQGANPPGGGAPSRQQRPQNSPAAQQKSAPAAQQRPHGGAATGRNGAPARQRKPQNSAAAQQSPPAAQQQRQQGGAAEPAGGTGAQQRPAQRQQPRRRLRIRYGRLFTILFLPVAVIAGAAMLLSRAGSESTETVGRQPDIIESIGSGQTLPDGVRVLDIEVGGKTKSAARDLITAQAEKLAAASGVTIRMDGEEFTVSSEDISLGYDIESVLQRAMQYDDINEGAVDVTTGETVGNITNIFTWNSKTLEIALGNIADQFNRSASEPSAIPQEQPDGSLSFTFEDGSSGREFDVAANLAHIESMFSSGSFSFDMDGIYTTTAPSATAAEIQQDFGLRATYTTSFENDPEDETVQNRIFNIEMAAEMINGLVVAPGEEWSFNSYIGPRTYETGWKGANGIADGKGYSIQAGGGICQVSTTLYNALLRGDVEIVYRRAHSIPSSYVPRGLDATVDSITNIDLKFRNDTGAPLYFYYTTGPNPDDDDENIITFYIYGKKLEDNVRYEARSEMVEYIHNNDVIYTDDDTIPRGYKVVTVEKRRGFVVDVFLDKYVNDVLESSEKLYTDTYKGNPEEARRGTASPKYYEPPEGAVPIE